MFMAGPDVFRINGTYEPVVNIVYLFVTDAAGRAHFRIRDAGGLLMDRGIAPCTIVTRLCTVTQAAAS